MNRGWRLETEKNISEYSRKLREEWGGVEEEKRDVEKCCTQAV